MTSRRVSKVIYVLIVTLLIIGIALVYGYSSLPYVGVVRIDFRAQVVAYNQDGGDYAFITLDGLMINFSRTMPSVGQNLTSVTSSYLGHLYKPLYLTLNVTLSSKLPPIVLPTTNIEFADPGIYVVTYVHLIPSIPSGTYLVNLTYTQSLHQNAPHQIWASIIYYYEVE